MATISFTCGAEHTSEFVTSHWFSNVPNSGAVTVDTTHVDTGSNAIKITADAYLRKVANTGTYFACRMRIWVASGSVNGTRFFTVDDGVDRQLLYSTAAGKLLWYDGTASTNAVPTDQWVTVDLEVNSSANPHTTQWRINGVAQTSTSAAVAAGNVVQYYLGAGSGGVGSDRWADNLAVSLTPGDYPIPAGTAGWSGSAEVWTPDPTGPVWTTPADTVSMTTTPELKFNSPASGVAQHFYLQLDTANTFDTGNLRNYDSSTNQTNWDYWNGSAWTALPSTGLASGFAGNEIRYTVTSALSAATWYRRVRAGTLV